MGLVMGLVMTCRCRAPSSHPRARVVAGGSAKRTKGRSSKSFKRLVDVLASGMFALRAEIPYPYVAARPKPDISVRFAQLGREIMVFHFEDRSDQLGVRGWLDDQSSGRVAHYRIQANPAFLNNLRGLGACLDSRFSIPGESDSTLGHE